MKIMLVSPSMGAGGAERVLALLASGLVERGHEVALVAPHGLHDADLAGVQHVRRTLPYRGRTPYGAARVTAQLAFAVRQLQPDVLHAQNAKMAAMASIATRLARPFAHVPLLATYHGVLPSEYARAARLLRLADHVACVSGDLRTEILAAGLPTAKASVIHNAVRAPKPLAPARRAAIDAELGLERAPVAAIVARIVPQKAHTRFVRAARVTAERVPQARFLIVGDGPLRSQAEAAVRQSGLGEKVVFAGERSDATELIARADVLVFSSDWEGLSIAALEAMATGTPVLSTDVQGMHELLADGAGEVVPLDNGELLGEKLADLLVDSARRKSMGAAGERLIETKFSAAAMTDAYEQRYQQLVTERARSSRRGPRVG
jgi:glycosyltransferase involved in cell wall biosynthesis